MRRVKVNKSTFFYSAAVLALSNLGLQALGFFYRIFLSRLAGAEGLGVYRLVFMVYTIVHSVCLSGVTMACSRLSAEKYAQGKKGQVRQLTRFASLLFASLFACFAILIVFFHTFIAETLLGDIRTADALLMMLCCMFLTGFENVFKSIFIGTQNVKFTAASELSEQCIRIAAVLYLLYRFGGGDYSRIAWLIMLGMTISEIFSVLFLSGAYLHLFSSVKYEGNKTLPSAVLQIALPVSAAALCDNIISSASSVMLPQRLVASGLTKGEAIAQLGIISGMALPLILLPVALISSVCTVLVPSIGKSMAIKRITDVKTRVVKAITITGMIGIPATAALVPLAPALARIFFAQDLSIGYMAMLGLAGILSYYQMMTGSILNGMGLQKKAVMTAIAGESIQLALTWFLAAQPALRIYGYIMAMIISTGFILLVNLFWISNYLKLSWETFSVFCVPVICGAAIWLWVRFFYFFFLGIVGAQTQAVFLTACSAGILYLGLLQLFGIHITAYMQKLHVKTGKLSAFTFL